MTQAVLLGPWMSRSGQKLGNLLARPSHEDLTVMKGSIEAGKVKSVIDRRRPLGEVTEAIRYLEQGHARGKSSSPWNRDGETDESVSK